MVNMFLPESIKSFITAIYGENRCSCICLGHSAISFKYDDFGPDLIIYAFPFAQNFFDVILQKIR